MSVSWPLVALFAASTTACFAVAYRESGLRNPDSRRGLRWLLVVAGAWSGFQTAGLLMADEGAAIAVYTLGLVVGFATVGPWLYFCSAYTGHEYHRRPAYRRAAIGTYLVVVALKVTNPIHGYYFAASLRFEPVRTLVVDHGPLYWLSFALAYGLTAVGFVLLYRLHRESPESSLSFLGLFAVAGLTVVPNAVTALGPETLPPLSYEPVGVAAFAIGASYLAEETFLTRERATIRSFREQTAGGIVVLDEDGVVRDHNDRAAALFPDLADGVRIEAVSETLATEYRTGRPALVETSDGDEVRTCVVTSEPLEVGKRTFGHALLIQDVTVFERQRERIKRHDRQLGDMAGAIAHELRNSVTIANGYLSQTTDRLDAGDAAGARESVDVARTRLDRIERIVEDLHTLVRYTRDAGEPRFVAFEAAVRDAAEATADAPRVVVDGEGSVFAAPTRFKQVIKNAIRFAADNEATTVEFALREDGFEVTDDGRYAARGRGDLLFEYESAEPSADAGMALSNVRALADGEEWRVEPDETHDGGMRYRVRDVRVELGSDPDDCATDGSDRVAVADSDASDGDDVGISDPGDAAGSARTTNE